MNPPAGLAPPSPPGDQAGSGSTARASADPAPAPAATVPPTLLLFGVPFHDLTEDEALAWIAARARTGPPAQVVTSNLDFLLQAWRDPEMHRIHLEADLVVADGWPPVRFSPWFGPPLRARVAGSDLVPRLGQTARDHGLSLYALGGQPGVGQEALKILAERSPGLRVAGWGSPPLAPLLDMDHAGLRRQVREARPDILFVAFGAPKQDKWIRMNAAATGTPVAMGVGGSLDFIAGSQTRAPRWVQRLGLEWFWRLAGQPRRLFKRYSSNLIFLAVILVRLGWTRISPGGRRASPAMPEAGRLAAAGVERVSLPPLASATEAAAFLSRSEPEAARRWTAVDLSGFSWLSSLELGALARLARASRRGGRRLFLCGASVRVIRLLRLLRLDRYLEVPGSPEEGMRRLDELRAPAEQRSIRWTQETDRLTVELPEEFEGEAAWEASEELARRSAGGELRNLVVDGARIRYIDSSGLCFLRTAWHGPSGKSPGAMTLRGFPAPALAVLRGHGLGEIPVETASRS